MYTLVIDHNMYYGELLCMFTIPGTQYFTIYA